MAATIPLSSASASPVILARRYRLERRLAQGGMAEVWVATDLSLTRQVAVKLLKPSLAADPVVAERFRREAIAVAQLSHPNIVAVFDAIEDVKGSTRRQAVVMQLVSGKSLRQLLDEQRRLSPALTMHIGKCIASALDCAHRANLVHRDVKPGNILVTPDGSVLLTDFGIAKGIDDGDDLTSPNIMMGTAKYLSPEQVRGNRLDGRADLYSLGLVLYECLAGRVPFLGETDADTALARLNRDPTDLARLRPTLPHGLADLIHRLLARDPAARIPTGADLRNELIGIEGATPAGERSPAARPTDRPPPAAAASSNDAPRPGGPRLFDDEIEPTPIARPAPPASTRPPGDRAPVRPADSRPPPGPRPPSGPRPPAVQSAAPRPEAPVTRSGRPAGPPVVADRTPPNPRRPGAQPNRELQTRHGPTMVVLGALVLIAAMVAAFLWNKTHDDAAPVSTDLLESAAEPSTTAAPALATIAGLISYDPDGDGDEQPDTVGLALDGNPATAWQTACYADRYLGAKGRVGLVVDLGTPTTGLLRITITSAPSQLRIFTSAADTMPTTWDAWGADVSRFDDTEPMVIDATVNGRWVLLGLYELGPDEQCQENPFRGAIAEVAVVG